MTYTVPSQGFMYWPVGTGDSSTIVIEESTFFQLDLFRYPSSTKMSVYKVRT